MTTEDLSLFLRPKILKPRAEHGSEITRRLAINKVGRMLATAMQDRTIRLLDARTGEEVQRFVDNFLCTSIAFSPRGDIVATGGVDRVIKIWDIRTGERLATLEGHTYPVLSLSFSPDGDRLVSGGGDSILIVWDIDNRSLQHQLKGHSLYVVTCQWDPNGGRIVSGSVDSFIGVWDPDTGRRIDWIQEHGTAVHTIRFSPDGQTLASGSSDLTIKIWDASGEKLQLKRTLSEHSSEVRCVAFSSDGKYLASGSSDKDLYVWTTDEYVKAGESSTYSEVDGLEWFPGTSAFVTADGSGAVIRWEVEDLENVLSPFKSLLAEIEADTARVRRDEFIRRFEELRGQYDPEVLRDKRVFYVVWQCKRALGLLKGTPRT